MMMHRCVSIRTLVLARRARCATISCGRNPRVNGGVRQSRAVRRCASSTRTSSSLAAASDTTETAADATDTDDVPEYVRRASTPSDFEEHSWGDDPKIAETCLRAMRIQWTHGFTSTPKGFARATHGFGEILAGMQPAACEAIFDAFEAPVRSVLDPFMGGGTTLIVGQSLGCRAIGVDVSPLACFVSANRNWRASTEAVESTRVSARLAMADVISGKSDDESDDNNADGDAVVAVPRAWRPVRNALSAYVESERFASVVDEAHRDRVVEALWFCLSVALQRTQKSQNKRRPRKGGKRRNNNDGNGGDKNVEVFLKIVDEYVERVREFQAICDAAPNVAPPAEIYNVDVRKFKLDDDEKVDAVLTSCPYPAVYDYLSFARKVRAGSGAVVKKSTTSSSLNATSAYVDVVVPGDRNWPKTWMEGEIGSRKALRSNPYEFAAVWQREQEDWLAVVADSLRPGGRAAVMVGDGANIDTRKSIVDAATKFGLLELGGATMKLTATMADGQTVYNQARTEHLIVFQKP